MPKALIVGGTGQIGHAIAERLLDDGWTVGITSRSGADIPAGAAHHLLDPRDAASMAKLVGSRTDLLLSCAAFDADDGPILAEAGQGAGRIIAISSASVYCDAQGRTLDEAAQNGFPAFMNPLTESGATVGPGPQTYSTRKVAMERALREHAKCPVNILRPCAIHGAHSRHAREWWFVKRLLDCRSVIPLAYEGSSRFQTTSCAAIAQASTLALKSELPEIVNVADADCPTVAEIGRAIAGFMGMTVELVGLVGKPDRTPKHGRTPWSIARPMIVSSLAPPSERYRTSVEPAITWLVRNVPQTGWEHHLPQLAAYPYDLFDYAGDDAALEANK